MVVFTVKKYEKLKYASFTNVKVITKVIFAKNTSADHKKDITCQKSLC